MSGFLVLKYISDGVLKSRIWKIRF